METGRLAARRKKRPLPSGVKTRAFRIRGEWPKVVGIIIAVIIGSPMSRSRKSIMNINIKDDVGACGTETYPGTEPVCNTGTITLERCEPAAEQGESLGQKADHAVESIGVGMETVGRSIREHTPDVAVL